MAIVAYLSANQITPITGYNYIAELQYGTNGQYPEIREVDAGKSTNRVGTNATWDPDVEDGIDSGWLNAHYTLKVGTNGLTWVTDASVASLSYNVGTLTSVSAIHIRAAVQNQAAMLWQNTQLNFYRGTTLQETVNLNSFGVDMTGSGGTAQQLVTIQPARTDNNRVTLDGQFRMIAPVGVYPDVQDVFSQVFSFAGGRQTSSMSTSGTSEVVEPITFIDAQAPGIAGAPFSDELLDGQQYTDILQSDGASML